MGEEDDEAYKKTILSVHQKRHCCRFHRRHVHKGSCCYSKEPGSRGKKTDKGGQAQEVERQKDYLGRPKSQDQEYQGGIPCPNRGPKRIRFLFYIILGL